MPDTQNKIKKNDSYLQHPSDKHTAAPHNEKHTSMSLGAWGRGWQRPRVWGGAAGQAGGWAIEEGGQILTSPSICSSSIARQELQQLTRKELPVRNHPPSGIARPCPPY